MLSQITDWLKFVIVVGPVLIGVIGGSIKFFERFSAVPQLQKDVKFLKHDMRYVVRAIETSTKIPYNRRERYTEGDGE